MLGWTGRQTGAFRDDVGVARFDGWTFEPRKLYSLDDRFVTVSVGASPSGRVIVAAQHQTPGSGGRRRIMVTEAPSITGAWGDMAEISKPQAGDYRDPRVGAGGIVAVAYGVHAGNDSRSDVVADGPSPSCSGAQPTVTATATPTATASASPSPQPPPPPPPAVEEDDAPPTGKLQKVAFKGGKVRITLRLDETAIVTFKVDGKPLAKRTVKAGRASSRSSRSRSSSAAATR